jgi:hypothetical protein
VRVWVILSLALLLGACAGRPFNVRPVARVAPDAIGPAASAGPLSVRASAVWDEAWLLDTLDANLILARVLPVRIHLENTAPELFSPRKVKLELAGQAGDRFKHLSPKKAMKAIESYYEISITSKTGRARYREDFLTNTLDLEAPLAPGESRQGLVFFAIPEAIPGPVPLALTVVTKSGETTIPLH